MSNVVGSEGSTVPPPPPTTKVDAVVSQQNNKALSDYGTIQAALDAAAAKGGDGMTQFGIHVKSGTYKENVTVKTTKMDRLVDPARWTGWPGAGDRDNTVYYAEYQNCGRRAATDQRAGWAGYIRSGFDPSKFTVAQFIDGNSWLPKAGVPFSPGLDPGQSPCSKRKPPRPPPSAL